MILVLTYSDNTPCLGQKLIHLQMQVSVHISNKFEVETKTKTKLCLLLVVEIINFLVCLRSLVTILSVCSISISSLPDQCFCRYLLNFQHS